MNKKIIFLILSGFLTFPLITAAQLHSTGSGTSVTLQSIVTGVENAAGLIFGAFAVVCFVVAGILFLTSQGAPEKIKTAKAAFIWGVAGVVVGIIAFSIIALIAGIISA